MRVFLPIIKDGIAYMKSGSAYRVTGSGWIRLNHPKNKHERKYKAKHGRVVKPHR